MVITPILSLYLMFWKFYVIDTICFVQNGYQDYNISNLIMQCKENTEISAYCKPIKTDTYIH